MAGVWLERRSGLKGPLLFLVLSFSASAWGQRTVTESFETRVSLDSSDMVWNTARGELHPPLFVQAYDDGGGAADLAFSVGNGEQGSFSSLADYTRLGTVTGTVIHIDTETHTELNLTEVHILSGYELRPSGQNPLVLRVLGDVIVDGHINCSGEAGASSGQGGVARCGGGGGGNTGVAGAAGGTSITGGGGGGSESGGGGGGAYIKAFSALPDKADGTAGLGGSGGVVGTRFRDDAFLTDGAGGGSGGGGGGSSGTDLSTGAGGGAGGGNIQIYLAGNLTVSASGSITANGGAGGDRSAVLAGGGGGGGGGSIQIFAGGDITNGGSITALAGAGGNSGSGGQGGTGFFGRTWLVEKDGFASGVFEDPETQLNSPGDVRYETGVNYTVVSRPVDLRNTRPEILSLPIGIQDPGGATLNYEVSFGSYPGDPALLSFAAPATYLNSEQARYFAFRIQLDNTSGTTPARVTDLSVSFNGFTQDDFAFVGACGAVGVDETPWVWVLFLLWPLALLAWLRWALKTGPLPCR